MKPMPAAIAEPTPQGLALSGSWTARGIGAIQDRLDSLRPASQADGVADASRIEALDTAGAWTLHKLLARLRDEGFPLTLQGGSQSLGRGFQGRRQNQSVRGTVGSGGAMITMQSFSGNIVIAKQ